MTTRVSRGRASVVTSGSATARQPCEGRARRVARARPTRTSEHRGRARRTRSRLAPSSARPDERMVRARFGVHGDRLDVAGQRHPGVALVEHREVGLPGGDRMGADDLHACVADRRMPRHPVDPPGADRVAVGGQFAQGRERRVGDEEPDAAVERGRERGGRTRDQALVGWTGSSAPSGSGPSGSPALTITSRVASSTAASPSSGPSTTRLRSPPRVRAPRGQRSSRRRGAMGPRCDPRR